MSRANLFLDSSALFVAVASSVGAARALLVLAKGKAIILTVSEQVIVETERAVTKKLASVLPFMRSALRDANIKIMNDPSAREVQRRREIISDKKDVPIVVAAMQSKVDFLVTLDRKHFIDDPAVARRSGLRIGTPGDALNWLRER